MVNTLLPLRITKATVTKRGKKIIGPIDVEIGDPGITMLMGPNGSGKTTLLRLMHGLERPRSGSVKWACMTSMAQQHQAYVFQTPIIMRKTVMGNLLYPLRLKKIPMSEAKNKAQYWLEKVGLEQAAELEAGVLSGGEKQKLALARALAPEPKILFLDEPTTNLDGTSTREIETIITNAKNNGVKIITTSHDTGQAKRIADHIIFLFHGKIHETGSADTFLTNPETREATAYLKGEIVE